MAVLRTTARERAARGLLVGMALALTGCVIMEVFGEGKEKPFSFPHRVHIEDEGLECGDCHFGADSEDEPGMPVQAQCMLCHEDIDEEQPPEKRIENLFVDGKFVATRRSALPEEVIFSHLQHVESGQECSDCHGGIEQSDSSEDYEQVSMDDCMACHDRGQVANECSTCHSVIDEEWQPDSHQHHWMRAHGSVVRSNTGARTDQCSMCHTESSCNMCHAEEPPENHTNYWRRRGHPVAARMDRDN